MEMQQISSQTRNGEPEPSASGDAAAIETLAACRRLADVGDAAIDQVASGNAQAFLEANTQAGGQ